MTYQQLSIEEREIIQIGICKGNSLRHIAGTIGRSVATVSRELRRNSSPEKHLYLPSRADLRATLKRSSRGRTERLKSDTIRAYVTAKIKQRWSPEQISGRLKKEAGLSISHEAIYQFIYAQLSRDGRGPVLPGRDDLRPYLRRRRIFRVPKGACRRKRTLKPFCRSIDERPVIVGKRTRVGDWESDTVCSAGYKPGINTVVERKIGLVFMTKLHGNTTAETVRALQARFCTVPAHLKHTLTTDNGIENTDWNGIEKVTGATCYAAHPYHAWERGSNENANGLIRQYFPKNTDFTRVSDAEIAAVEYALNTRPRKRLGWATPLEAWSVALTH